MNDKMQNAFMGLHDIGQAETLLNMQRRDNPDDSVGTEEMLQKLLEAIRAAEDQGELTGDADDFHNFSVSVSKLIQDNGVAFEIVQAGLKIHPQNTDLLADALLYGYNSGERERCKEYYKKLKAIDQCNWTWRAFSFTIDYMLDSRTSSGSENFTFGEILNVVEAYQKAKPDDENAWLSEFKVYDRTNQREKGLEALKAADEKFDFCPKCWLRYADVLVDRGKFEEAEPLLKKLRRNPKSTESINGAYMHLLDGQCKMAELMNSDAYEDGEVEPKEVMKVYRAFRMALKAPDLRDSIKRQVEEYITRLSVETDIEYPDMWWE